LQGRRLESMEWDRIGDSIEVPIHLHIHCLSRRSRFTHANESPISRSCQLFSMACGLTR
jgi:hypothetical protein